MAALASALTPWKTQEPEPFGSDSGFTALEMKIKVRVLMAKNIIYIKLSVTVLDGNYCII